MKIRQGFVSNSSSSSFICAICKETETSMNGDVGEVDMCQCECGHIMCIKHIQKLSAEEFLQEIKTNNVFGDEIKELLSCDNMEEIKQRNLEKLLEDTMFDYELECFYDLNSNRCPVCKKNNRS